MSDCLPMFSCLLILFPKFLASLVSMVNTTIKTKMTCCITMHVTMWSYVSITQVNFSYLSTCICILTTHKRTPKVHQNEHIQSVFLTSVHLYQHIKNECICNVRCHLALCIETCITKSWLFRLGPICTVHFSQMSILLFLSICNMKNTVKFKSIKALEQIHIELYTKA